MPTRSNRSAVGPSSNASTVAENDDQFTTWADAVGLSLATRSNPGSLPESVTLMLRESKRYPPWLKKLAEKPAQVAHIPEALRKHLGALTTGLDDTWQCSEDRDLSEDVSDHLSAILSVTSHEYVLSAMSPEPCEAERRAAVDYLMAQTWNYPLNGEFACRLECELQLPNKSTVIHRTKADSVVFILHTHDEPVKNAGVELACSSLREGIRAGYRCVLHWATEYKRRKRDYPVCSRQVAMAMVSGLYQRRAYGFPEHLVFGTVHVPEDKLEVLVGKWGLGPERGDKIFIHKVASFRLGAPVEMLQFFLLMRQVQVLGRTYKTDISELKAHDLRNRRAKDKSDFDWPPEGEGGSRTEQSGRTDLASVEEGEGEVDARMRDSVTVVEYDEPLSFSALQAVASTDPDTKVMQYLSTLVPAQCGFQP